jgi:hypothetical protein
VTFDEHDATPAATVQVGEPRLPRDPWVGLATIANVRLLASASVPVSVITFAVFSVADTDWAFATGIVLMVTVAAVLSTVPSFTLKVNESGPVALFGVYVTVAVQVETPVPLSTTQDGAPSALRVPLDGEATMAKVKLFPSVSVP